MSKRQKNHGCERSQASLGGAPAAMRDMRDVSANCVPAANRGATQGRALRAPAAMRTVGPDLVSGRERPQASPGAVPVAMRDVSANRTPASNRGATQGRALRAPAAMRSVGPDQVSGRERPRTSLGAVPAALRDMRDVSANRTPAAIRGATQGRALRSPAAMRTCFHLHAFSPSAFQPFPPPLPPFPATLAEIAGEGSLASSAGFPDGRLFPPPALSRTHGTLPHRQRTSRILFYK
jgi:hypothetical protein